MDRWDLAAATRPRPGASRNDEAWLLPCGPSDAARRRAALHVEAPLSLAVFDASGGFAWGQPGGELLAAAVRANDVVAHEPAPRERLRSAAIAATRALQNEVIREPRRLGLCAAAAVVRLERSTLHAATVGDVRIYRLRGDDLVQLTRDDVLSDVDSEERGESPARALHRRILVRALGHGGELDPTSYVEEPLERGDVLLVCTRGVHAAQDLAQLRELLRTRRSAEEATAALLAEASGTDEATVLVAKPLPVVCHG